MRKVILSPKDFDLFDNDVTFAEFEFFHKHWDAFRRMWREQGQKFWIKFIVTFRTFATEYGVIKEIPQLNDTFLALIDSTFIFLHEQFIESKYRGVKNLIDQILVLAQHKGTIHLLQQKSFSKDPFYIKETRDCFRFLFGPPTEKVSYIKAYILHDLYTKFGGSVCKCLKKWLSAEEVDPNDESFWNTAAEVTPTKSVTVPDIAKDEICSYCNIKVGEEPSRIYTENMFVSFLREKRNGHPCGPWFIPGWPLHEDPRFFDSANPLYDLNSDPETDWRLQLDFNKYEHLMKFVRKNYPCPDVEIEPDPAAAADEDTIAMMKGMFEAGIGESVFENLANKRGMGIDNVVKMFEIQDNLKQVKERQKKDDRENKEVVKTFSFDVTEFVKSEASYNIGQTPIDQKDLEANLRKDILKKIADTLEHEVQESNHVGEPKNIVPGDSTGTQDQIQDVLQQTMVMGKGTVNITMKAHNWDGAPLQHFMSRMDEQAKLCSDSMGHKQTGATPESPMDFSTLASTLTDLLGNLIKDQEEHDSVQASAVNISITQPERTPMTESVCSSKSTENPKTTSKQKATPVSPSERSVPSAGELKQTEEQVVSPKQADAPGGDPKLAVTHIGMQKQEVMTSTSAPGKVATSTSSPGQLATSTSSPGKVVTSTSTEGQLVTSTSTPGQVATSTSVPGQVTTSTSTPGKVLISTSTPGQVATSTSAPGQVATSTSSPGKVVTSISTQGQVATSTSAPGQVTTSTSTPGQLLISTSTPGQVATSTSAPGQVTTSSSTPGQVTTSTSTPGQVLISTSSSERLKNSIETIRKQTSSILGDSETHHTSCSSTNPRLEKLFQRAETDLSALIKVGRVLTGESLSDVETPEDEHQGSEARTTPMSGSLAKTTPTSGSMAKMTPTSGCITKPTPKSVSLNAAQPMIYPRPEPPRNITRVLNKCANCGKQEPALKTYKKCQKCKEMSLKDTKYYCGKNCQVEDWKKRHKAEHELRQPGGLVK